MVGPTARRLSRLIFRAPTGPALHVVGSMMRFVTIGFLPPALRSGLRLSLEPVRKRSLATLGTAVRHLLPALPPLIEVIREQVGEIALAQPITSREPYSGMDCMIM